MEQTQKHPFQDHTLDIDTRVHDLVSRLNDEEKIESMLQYQPPVERLGLGGYKHGTEAAHGIAWLGEATFFPQPTGLACTWDAELMKKIGNVISDEARVVYKRNPEVNGLTLWAPTVDMERDPRWGRNEEAYGEDPKLTGELTSHLVQGIQGDHPTYLKAVATLKHFLGNNNEVERGSGSSSIDPRNMREYYLKAFEQPFVEGGAKSMMTAYNSINGTPAILHPLVNEVVKGEWGMDGFIVSDAGDVMGIKNDHHYYDSHTPGVAESVKAGIDSITDDPELSKTALREALANGQLTFEDIDQALFNTFRVRFLLGEFDPAELNPYAHIGEEAMMTAEAKALSLEASRKSIVLLKNDNQTLPLSKTATGSVAVIGELGNAVYRDWYSGTLPYAVTALEGIQQKVNSKVSYQDGNDRITLTSTATGALLSIQPDPVQESVTASVTSANPNDIQSNKPITGVLSAASESTTEQTVFELSDWGFGSYTLRAPNHKYWTSNDDQGIVTASADEAYGWFVKEVFGLQPQANGTTAITTWNGKTVSVNPTSGQLTIIDTPESLDEHASFEKTIVENGLEQAIAAAKEAETAIVFIGNNPLINGKEEIDRPSLELAASQLHMVQEVYKANPNTVVVVVGSYPFAMEWVEEHIPAIIYLSHVGQELGNAVADVLYGDYAPAGRLNMTWYRSEEQLSDIRDYDIIRTGRTYQYFEGDVLYPFGHGLTYATFQYSDIQVVSSELEVDEVIELSVQVKNISEMDSEEVVQLYTHADHSRVKRPIKTLQAFRRIHLAAGTSQTVHFTIPVKELSFWDVTRDLYCVEAGTYTLMIGRSSADIAQQMSIKVNGEVIPARDLTFTTQAVNYDNYHHVQLGESKEGGAVIEAITDEAWILFQDVDFGTGVEHVEVRMATTQDQAKIEIVLDQVDQASVGAIVLASASGEQHWSTEQTSITGVTGKHDVYLKLSKGVRISTFQFGASSE